MTLQSTRTTSLSLIHHSMPSVGEVEQQVVSDVLNSGRLSRAEKVEEFEVAFCRMLGRKYACTVSSGTAALCVLLESLSDVQGREVILPTYVCDSLLTAVRRSGAIPVLVDVCEDGNIDPQCVEEAISCMTRVVIVPHMFGTPARVAEIMAFGVPVIEDCAMSVGARHRGRLVGSFGYASIFSFYATKMLCTGEGGMVVTDDEDLHNKVVALRRVLSLKMTEIEAALGLVQLRCLPQFVYRRCFLAGCYNKLLERSELVLPPSNPESVHYRYVTHVTKRNRDELRGELRLQRVECGLGVLECLHRVLVEDDSRFPVACRLQRTSLSLPIYPSLTLVKLRRVAQSILDIESSYD